MLQIADTLTIEDVQNRNALDLMARVQATNLPAIAEKFMPIETLKDSALGRWTALEAVHETGACSHAANSHFSSEGLRREVRDVRHHADAYVVRFSRMPSKSGRARRRWSAVLLMRA